jgi:hypothetical protein
MNGAALTDIRVELLFLSLICVVLFFLTLLFLRKGEAYAKKTGNMALF